jgi:hypothetical protein
MLPAWTISQLWNIRSWCKKLPLFQYYSATQFNVVAVCSKQCHNYTLSYEGWMARSFHLQHFTLYDTYHLLMMRVLLYEWVAHVCVATIFMAAISTCKDFQIKKTVKALLTELKTWDVTSCHVGNLHSEAAWFREYTDYVLLFYFHFSNFTHHMHKIYIHVFIPYCVCA